MSATVPPMFRREGASPALGTGVLLIAVLRLASLVTAPLAERELSASGVIVSTMLLVGHSLLYFFESRSREHVGDWIYIALQGLALFGFGLVSQNLLTNIALYAALTIHAAEMLHQRLSRSAIVAIGIALFACSTSIGSGIYRGATVALMLAGVSLFASAARRLSIVGHTSTPGATQAPPISADPKPLSEREREVLHLASQGHRSHEIAAVLGISERTVKAHLASVYRKLGVESRAAAVTLATERGLFSRRMP